ncbi:MAG: YARHG domain-containing protein, partial [Oscillospiraceae bacterium]|nr:YARHG domain-containing protein [Oscillospiraceae bacterium]
PVTPAPAPASAAPAATPASAPAGITAKMKIAIAVAAGVVVLGGGFAAAWFSGALDSIPFVASSRNVSTTTRGSEEERRTTVASRDEDIDVEDVEDVEGDEEEDVTTTVAATTAAATTQAATTTAATTAGGMGGGGGGGGGGEVLNAFARRQSPAMTAIFNDMDIEPYISSDASSRGAVEESVINLSSIVLGSVRNLAREETRDGGNVFGFECNVAFDVPDAYLYELLDSDMFMYSGIDAQTLEILRLIGASEFNVSVEAAGEIIDSMLDPMFKMDADWLVNSRSVLSASAFMDMENILIAIPSLSSKVFRIENESTPIPIGDFEALLDQTFDSEAMLIYIDQLMPYIEEMAVAALNELDDPVEGKEDITLGGRSVTVDTIDIEISQASAAKAIAAALTVIKYSPEAQDLIVEAFNEIMAEMVGMTLDRKMLSMGIDSTIAQMNEAAEYAYYEEPVKIRIYMYDGVLSGIAMSIPEDASQFAFALIEDYGYSFWYKDLYYSEYEMLDDDTPSLTDHGIGDHFEIHGSLNSGANGYSGDFWLKLREYDEVFDAKILTFSDLDTQVVFGMPVITGKFNVKMSELYNAFIDKKDSDIYEVASMAYTMEELDEMPMIKDMEFTLELNATDNDYTTIFRIEDPSRNSKAAISFRGYFVSKTLSPPQGPIVDVEEVDESEELQVEIVNEFFDSINTILDGLLSAGYDLTWVKPLIEAEMLRPGALGMAELDDIIGGTSTDVSTQTSAGGAIITDFLNEYTIEGYIFELSDTEYIVAESLLNYPLAALILGRNEIYARHGWVFDDIELQIYFNQQDWYVPLYDNDSIELNTFEETNVLTILEIEKILGG